MSSDKVTYPAMFDRFGYYGGSGLGDKVVNDWRRWLEGFTYKDDWAFRADWSPAFDQITFQVKAFLVDPGKPEVYDQESGQWRRPVTQVRFSKAMDIRVADTFDKKEFFRVVVYETLKSLELHEIMEWMKVGDQNVYDPHPAEKNGAGQMGPNFYRLPADPPSQIETRITLTES